MGEEPERARELSAGGGQLVDEAAGPLRILPRNDEALVLEVAESSRENVRRNARDVGEQLAEPARPLE